MYEKHMELDATLLNDLFDDIEFDLEQGNNISNVISDDLIREKPMKVNEVEKIKKIVKLILRGLC